MEQMAAQQLRIACGEAAFKGRLYHWRREGGRAGEVDFLVEIASRIVPVEVKSGAIGAMTLEHYPGMTEKAIEEIVAQAQARWKVLDALVIHRVGRLKPTDQIVLVAVTSAHRGDAFAACEFIMDYLKTRAPFWKKEETGGGARWVAARESDDIAAERWRLKG